MKTSINNSFVSLQAVHRILIITKEQNSSTQYQLTQYTTMLKSKLKLPEKARRVFPDRLGSLIVGVEGKEEENGESDWAFESGEELEILEPNGLGSELGSEDEYVNTMEELSESMVRQRPGKERPILVSVKEVIAADEKRSDLQYELSQKEINMEKLQRIANTGLPDGGSLRATAWKLLLGYLPPSSDLWEKELTENRQKYSKLKEELLLSPTVKIHKNVDEEKTTNINQIAGSGKVDGLLRRLEISHEDHPLSLGKASPWNQYFQHTEIAEQIDRDLQRTHPDMKFFSGETSFSRKNREAMRNILLLFAKLNPPIRYVQGMNEVLAPIYYVFSTDPDERNSENAEADSFACFVRLLGDSMDHFCEQQDNSSRGILSTLSHLAELLKTNDEELWHHLEITNKVKPQFYAFRWITLLLTQEFNLQAILRIWDSLLSSPFGVQDMLLRICCAMLLCIRSRLLSGDFAANLKLLQHYPEINIEHLLLVAYDLTPLTSSSP